MVNKNWADQHFGQATKIATKAPAPAPRRTGLYVAVLFLGGAAAFAWCAYAGIFSWGPPPAQSVAVNVPRPAPARSIAPEPTPEPEAAPAQPEPEPAAKPTNQAHIASLRRGIALMTKEKNESESAIARLQTCFVLRTAPGTRLPPYSAAETIEEANRYLAQPDLSTQQKNSAYEAIRNANATLINARTRIKELAEKIRSLDHRMSVASAEIAAP